MSIMIATWFVADAPGDASKFAQVAGDSSTPAFQLVYWRCVAVFFTTSKMRNPAARHVFFTNTRLPVVDGLDFAELFETLEVQTVFLPITFRLQKSVADAWGNQFYILDIIRYLARHPSTDTYLVLDSDCVWMDGADRIEAEISAKSCLLYTLGAEAYGLTQSINGVTRQQMAQLAAQVFPDIAPGNSAVGIAYHGGEIFAATRKACGEIDEDVGRLWQQRLIAATGVSGYLEEAHFLSIIYRHLGYQPYSAEYFIKRMWTGFKHNNLTGNDVHLPIWHLPAEKKTGFKAVFRVIAEGRFPPDAAACDELIRRSMGVPHKSAQKLVLDLGAKIIEKLRGTLQRYARR